MYAIVDIETTGTYAAANGITEICIHIFDGNKVLEKFQTLINPGQPIPRYIQAFTGITNEMVIDAPKFEDIAHKIHNLLHDKIFVAHNVNFDFSFIKHQLALSGYDLQSRKLCTVRLSRKLIPNLASYSLGKLCSSVGIYIENRHRAGGDANATTILFEKLIALDNSDIIEAMLKRGSKEHVLPPNISKELVTNLPSAAGVYYFLNQKGKVIYVGKALNVKKRVLSHFSGHNPNKQRQDFLKNIHFVEHTLCGTELMALILESTEIKRLWPENNRALKKYEHKYGIFDYLDQNGYLRLGLDKVRNNSTAILTFNTQLDGINFLNRIVSAYNLCPRLGGVARNRSLCEAQDSALCGCNRTASEYNALVEEALEFVQTSKPSFMLVDSGRNAQESSCILIEKGKLFGMGYFENEAISHIEEIKERLNPYPSNSYVLNLILKYAEKHPYKVKPVN